MLLFVQICLSGTAFTWALEAIKLRKNIDQDEVALPLSADRSVNFKLPSPRTSFLYSLPDSP